ncbi:MAG: hypothetical protein FGM39_11850 [Phycisphaerales bacterium]|nr:hypothetical protein [Phycisphaerales bacterium]
MTRTTQPVRSLFLIAAIAVTGLVVAACGGSGGSSSSSAAESSAMPGGGGSAECSDTALQAPTTDAASTGGFGMLANDGQPVPAGTTVDAASVRSLCDSGWALAAANVTPPGGQMTAAVFLFEAEGEFWVPKSVADTCASGVPAALKAAGCQFVK